MIFLKAGWLVSVESVLGPAASESLIGLAISKHPWDLPQGVLDQTSSSESLSGMYNVNNAE